MLIAKALRIAVRLLSLICLVLPLASHADNFGPSASEAPYKPSLPIAIVGGTVIDATGAPPKRNHTVIIEGNKITRIGPQSEIRVPAGAHVFDASGMTVMPGLINSNQHMQLNPLYPAPVADLPIKELRERWEGNFANMERKAYVYLMQGVTSMRQTSGPRKRLLPIKERIDAGELPGPRVFLGGALIMSPEFFDFYVKSHNTPPESVEWLRNEFAYYVLDDIDKDTDALLSDDYNYWKLYLSDLDGGDTNVDFTDDELRLIIDKGRRHGKSIDVHATSTNAGYRRMLKFDIDTLEHPFERDFLLDDDIIEGYAKRGVIVDTLLRVRVAFPEHAMDPNRFNETSYIMSMSPQEYRLLMRYRDKMLFNQRNPQSSGLSIYDKRSSAHEMFGQNGPSYELQMQQREISRENMRRFIRAGVKFSMGTDSTSFLNFQQEDPNAIEMGYMVELGMSPMEAIIASTRNGAEVLKMLNKLGTLEVGKLADVIVVAGDPLKDMNAMKRVAVVIKDGVRYK